jgi:hypothetical protein
MDLTNRSAYALRSWTLGRQSDGHDTGRLKDHLRAHGEQWFPVVDEIPSALEDAVFRVCGIAGDLLHPYPVGIRLHTENLNLAN